MKIGFDISDLHSGRADGTTRYTYELAKRFPELTPEVDWLYFSSGQPSASYKLQATNYKLVVSSWPRFWTQSRLWLDLYKYQPDILFMPIQQLPYVRPGRMKTVCVVHDLAFHVYPEQFTSKDWALQHMFTAYAAREADHIIAVSQATAHDMATYYGREKNVSVVHHGVDHAQFRPVKPPGGGHGASPQDDEYGESWQALQTWQPQLKKPYLLYVGQIQPRKNLIRLIEAFELLKRSKQEPDLQLVLAGTHGWLNKPIYDRVKASSQASHIVMPGRVPEDLLPALYWHAEALLLPSLYEGFGMTIVEAMAAGCPVVTSAVSSMPEVAGEAAVLIDSLHVADIVRGIGAARAQRAELVAAGIQRAETFTWDRTARQTLAKLTAV